MVAKNKHIAIFGFYYFSFLGVVLNSRPNDVSLPPIWFFAAYCFLPCLAAYIVYLNAGKRTPSGMVAFFLLSILSFVIVFRIQMELIKYIPLLISDGDTYFVGLLNNFWVYGYEVFGKALIYSAFMIGAFYVYGYKTHA